jgi:hypothetical protein
MFGIRRTLDRLTLVLPLFVLAACADDAPVTSPVTVIGEESTEPASNRGLASVSCAADITSGTLSCGDIPVVDPESGLQRVTLGGQMLYVWLLSSNVSYNASTEIFQADVQVGNLIPQGLGSADGLTTTGIKVFHHTGPTVTSSTGPGTVMVANPDGIGTFTGSDQPYFEYLSYLPPPDPPTVYGTSLKTWQWNADGLRDISQDVAVERSTDGHDLRVHRLRRRRCGGGERIRADDPGVGAPGNRGGDDDGGG